ncbi:MAG: M20/M25/M40 family metallo-hydrolase [Acidimicrobiia bacterium]|nr:M20/M25/M40 family metallo-hydrolase [Acidimicrobiia bacterium]
MIPAQPIDTFRVRQPAMVEDLERLVMTESPSSEPEACRRAAAVLDEIAEPLIGRARWLEAPNGRTHLLWQFGTRIDVLLLGHIDTVFPLGTIDDRPFRIDDGIATGPGVYDMKSGLVIGIYAIASLASRNGVAFLVTDDEEIGSHDSRHTIEQFGANASAALVLEGTTDGHEAKAKTSRRGSAFYRLTITGRAAHAGMNPEDGINAVIELANVIPAVAALGERSAGTTVTPTMVTGGTALNVVPAHAEVAIDVRVTEEGEQQRVDAALRALSASLPGASLHLGGGPNRPPMPASATAELLAVAQAAAADLDLPRLEGAPVGGGSDASFIAGLGVPVLDGLGGVGSGGHQDDEWLAVDRMAERTALLARVIERLQPAPT